MNRNEIMTSDYRVCKMLRDVGQNTDNSKIINILIRIRQELKDNNNFINLDRNSYETLIQFLKIPNSKVIEYSLSILGNFCVHDSFRKMFGRLGGVPLLVLVIRNIDNDSILCKACRLIGNLAKDKNIAKEMLEDDVATILLKALRKLEDLSHDTITMIFRAVKKFCSIGDSKRKLFSEDITQILCKCLRCDEKKTVKLALEILCRISTLKKPQKSSCFNINRELLSILIELTKDNELHNLSFKSLSYIIYYHQDEVWGLLEGSGIAEIYIDHFQLTEDLEPIMCEALCFLCTQAAIRRKVHGSDLLVKLLFLCQGKNALMIIEIFSTFVYDTQSLTSLAQHKEFTKVLLQNVKFKRSACQLLEEVSRLEPPVMELVEEENLDFIIKNKRCKNVLKSIVGKQKFLKKLLMSGKIWEISKAGCSMEDVGSTGYAEGTIIHLLNSGDKTCKENVSLSIPFLVKPRDFELMYKFLAHHQAMTTIITLLRENPLEERVLASVIRLIQIFKDNYSNNYEKNTLPKPFFQDFNSESSEMEVTFEASKGNSESSSVSNYSENEQVTVEFDNGTSVEANKRLLCKNSPALDAMFNGHFVESGQQVVKISCCSRDAFLTLVQLLENDSKMPAMDVSTHLELISLTDQYLITRLNDKLTDSLQIKESSVLTIYQWCRNAGFTRNNNAIREKTYDFLLSSSEYLMQGMKSDVCRPALLEEISSYLSNSLKDLL